MLLDNDHKLIPSLADWNNGAGISLSNWIRLVGSFEDCIGYAALFWPRFVIYDDCVLRQAPTSAEIYKNWATGCRDNRSCIEAGMNHVHLKDWFPDTRTPLRQEVAAHIAEILREMWLCKLHLQFPERVFEMRVNLQEEPEVDAVITFWQRREGVHWPLDGDRNTEQV